MIATRASDEQSILLENISWETYERLLDEIGERPIRLTYDNGSLEIMTLSLGHESYSEFLGRMVVMLALELAIPIRSGGSTTMKRKLKKKGLEPDKCYWIANAPAMKGKRQFSPKKDPAPDLALEIDVSRSCLDRLPAYAVLRIPEIWVYDGSVLKVLLLADSGYQESTHSRAFPFLPMDKVAAFLRQVLDRDETSLLREFIGWVRTEVAPKIKAKINKPGRRTK